MNFEIKPCKTKGAIKTKPKKQVKLDFSKLKNYEIVVKTPVAIIIKIQNIELMVQKFGEITFKNCQDENLIKKIATRIYNKAVIPKTKP